VVLPRIADHVLLRLLNVRVHAGTVSAFPTAVSYFFEILILAVFALEEGTRAFGQRVGMIRIGSGKSGIGPP
jgi:hypothetical protein